MPSYNTSQFRKGLKVQIDGDPYLMIECNFVKPGKGQALYKCKLKNLVRGTQLDRTYKSGDSLEAADINEIEGQFLYRQGDQFVFMDTTSYEQYELTKEQVDEAAKWLKEGTNCSMLLVQQQSDHDRTAESHGAQSRILRAGGARRHGHEADQTGEAGNRRRSHLPRVHRNGRHDQSRHPHRRISGTCARVRS